MANDNLKFVTDKLKNAGFSNKQTIALLDKVDESVGGTLLNSIVNADKEGLGVILKETILPVLQSEISKDIEEYPKEAEVLMDREGAFVKQVDGSEWNRDKFLKVLGRENGKDGNKHVGALSPADYIALRRNGLSKAEADEMAEKYRQEFIQEKAKVENALMKANLPKAAVQSIQDGIDFDKDKVGWLVGNVIAPRAVEDLKNKAENGEDLDLNYGVLGADIAEGGLMFANPFAKGTGAVAKVAGNVGKAISGVKKVNNPLLKYGGKIAGEAAAGGLADGALSATAEGVAAASSDNYEFDPNKPLAVAGSSFTIPGLLGNATGALNQFAGGNSIARGISRKARRGEKTPTIQKMELEAKDKWIKSQEAKAAKQSGPQKQSTERSAERTSKDIDERYPDYRKEGFTDAEKYTNNLATKNRELTDAELELLGVPVEHFKGVGEKFGEGLGFVLSPASQVYARGAVGSKPDATNLDYKKEDWYKKLTDEQKKAVDEKMKAKKAE